LENYCGEAGRPGPVQQLPIAIIEIVLYCGEVVKTSPQPKPPVAAPKTASISWEGDTHDVIKGWPPEIRVDFGNSLREMQSGRPATLDVRPMTSIGAGVFELKTEDESAWYRLVYLARIRDVIYVLDCFEKDTRKTEKKDLRTAGTRLTQVNQRLMEERRDEKRTQRDQQARPRNKG
jgi:phage-related protein